jgi:hypothetical protein
MSQLIAISNAPNQSLAASVNVNGGTVSLRLSLYWNRIGGFWSMDVFDSLGNPLVSSVPLITGSWPAANILKPYQYLEIGSAFVINNGGNSTDYPNNINLGTGFQLLWDNNSDYVVTEYGGDLIIIGPPGPQGPPGPPGGAGGIYVMGTGGNLVPSLASGKFTQQATLATNATLKPPIGGTPGGIFQVQLIQNSAGGNNVTFDPYYKGLSAFGLDTNGSTQAVLSFQINLAGTSASVMNVIQNGWSIL